MKNRTLGQPIGPILSNTLYKLWFEPDGAMWRKFSPRVPSYADTLTGTKFHFPTTLSLSQKLFFQNSFPKTHYPRIHFPKTSVQKKTLRNAIKFKNQSVYKTFFFHIEDCHIGSLISHFVIQNVNNIYDRHMTQNKTTTSENGRVLACNKSMQKVTGFLVSIFNK